MNRALFNKRDIIVLLVLVIAFLAFFFAASKDKGERAEIWIGGELYDSFSLNSPFEIALDNSVVLRGDGESAWFEHSDCADKVCINTGRLSVSGEWAACLPNETVLKIVKGNENVDVVS